MKFISGIKEFKNSEIKIPFYHRASIGFFSGTSVHYICRKFNNDASPNIRELVLTTIPPTAWQCFRKITINTIEAKGIIFSITDVLRKLHINIHTQEAISIEPDEVHSVSLIVDLSKYIQEWNKTKPNNPKRKNGAQYEDELLEKLSRIKMGDKEIVKAPAKNNIQITKLDFLFSNTVDGSKGHIDPLDWDDNKTIKIDEKEIIKIDYFIKATLKLDYPPLYYTMFSDTEEKYIKILFLNPGQIIACIDVCHMNSFGAIAEFTEKILKHKYNLLASYNRQQMGKQSAHWYALIDITADTDTFFNQALQELHDTDFAKNVFLVECNSPNIPDNVILKFGQNKRNEDNEETSVFISKRKLLKKLISNDPIADDSDTAILKFISNHSDKLPAVKSERQLSSQIKLVKKIIKDDKNAAANTEQAKVAFNSDASLQQLKEKDVKITELQKKIDGLNVKLGKKNFFHKLSDSTSITIVIFLLTLAGYLCFYIGKYLSD